jgi:hypothetical protein
MFELRNGMVHFLTCTPTVKTKTDTHTHTHTLGCLHYVTEVKVKKREGEK